MHHVFLGLAELGRQVLAIELDERMDEWMYESIYFLDS